MQSSSELITWTRGTCISPIPMISRCFLVAHASADPWPVHLPISPVPLIRFNILGFKVGWSFFVNLVPVSLFPTRSAAGCSSLISHFAFPGRRRRHRPAAQPDPHRPSESKVRHPPLAARPDDIQQHGLVRHRHGPLRWGRRRRHLQDKLAQCTPAGRVPHVRCAAN